MSVNQIPLVMAVSIGGLGLTLPMLPWHSMVAALCQELLSVISFGASSILSKDLSMLSQGSGQSVCALVLCDVCKSWTSGHSPADFGVMTSARIASPCFTRPRFKL